MTQEEKELLLQDLCGRLPYNSIVEYKGETYTVLGITHGRLVLCKPFMSYTLDECPHVEEVKPYLFPLTEEILDKATEESNTLYKELICSDSDLYIENNKSNTLLLQAKIRSSVIKYFIIHHIDYNNLIGKGLAIDATGLNIY